MCGGLAELAWELEALTTWPACGGCYFSHPSRGHGFQSPPTRATRDSCSRCTCSLGSTHSTGAWGSSLSPLAFLPFSSPHGVTPFFYLESSSSSITPMQAFLLRLHLNTSREPPLNRIKRRGRQPGVGLAIPSPREGVTNIACLRAASGPDRLMLSYLLSHHALLTGSPRASPHKPFSLARFPPLE